MFVYGRSHLSLVLEGMLKGANFYIAIKWPVCGRNYIHSSQPYLKGRSLPCSSQNKSVKARGWRPRLVPPRRRGWASWSAPAGAQEGQDTGGPAHCSSVWDSIPPSNVGCREQGLPHWASGIRKT